MTADTRECEAIRLLRTIVEGSDEELPHALGEARCLLQTLRVRPTGRQPCTVTAEQLRAMARLRAQRRTQHEIAAELGLRRCTVAYHLRPSAAMQVAMAS